jgi:hypothetical protein
MIPRSIGFPNMWRSLSTVVVMVIALVAGACSGDRFTEDAVREDVSSFYAALFGEETNFKEAARYYPEECPTSLAKLALGSAFAGAFLGDVDGELRISVEHVELIGDNRALVSTSFGEGRGIFGQSDSEELWVLQDGRWRTTNDCDAYAAEAVELERESAREAKIGDRLEVGRVAVTIHDFHRTTEPRSDYDDPPRGEFLVVGFEFENIGTSPMSPWGNISIELFDGEGRTWDSEGYSPTDVGPGLSERFEMRWDVPRDADDFEIIVGEPSGSFGQNEVPADFVPYRVALR